MPGAYAHITMVNLMRESSRLERLGISDNAAAAVLDYLGYTELGAVSPDYPYLAISDSKTKRWADLMHYQRTGEVIKAGVEEVSKLSDEPKRRAFAWLLGYCAHVATDTTIHPVVELKVGPYAQNQKGHRVCEMHQDAYIYQRLNLGDVGLSEHLSSGLLRCIEPGRPGVVNQAVRSVWESMLGKVHPDEEKSNPPKVDLWHRSFDTMVNKIAEEGNRLLPIARHVAANCGLTYPLASEVDTTYIRGLKVPGGGTADYDDIFERAMESVGRAWTSVDKAVFANDADALAFFGNWNLDTGRDESNQLVFWS